VLDCKNPKALRERLAPKTCIEEDANAWVAPNGKNCGRCN